MKVIINNNQIAEYHKPYLKIGDKIIRVRKSRGDWSASFKNWYYEGKNFVFEYNPFEGENIPKKKRRMFRKGMDISISFPSKNRKKIKNYNPNHDYERFVEKINNIPESVYFLDLEMFEYNHSKLIEIGISQLNTKSGLINTNHFIIEEYLKFNNGIHVADNKFNFEFGKSKVVSLNDGISIIKNTFNYGNYIGGYCVSSDLKYLKSINIILPELTIFDSSKLFQVIHKEQKGLKDVCSFLGINPTKWHNAGNDSHKSAEVSFCLIKEFKKTFD